MTTKIVYEYFIVFEDGLTYTILLDEGANITKYKTITDYEKDTFLVRYFKDNEDELQLFRDMSVNHGFAYILISPPQEVEVPDEVIPE